MKYFKDTDFACKCCGLEVCTDDLKQLVDSIREELGLPLIVSSGFRCSKHNKEVGGVANSFHTKGLACDLRLTAKDNTKANLAKLQAIARKLCTGGVGLYDSFVHVDVRGIEANWDYRSKADD